MPRVPAAYHERRRRQILDAARARFAERGFHGTSMDEIIATAGLSAGSVYRQFAGKDELVLAVIDDVLAEMAAQVAAVAAQEPGEPARAVAALLRQSPGVGAEQRTARAQTRAIALHAWAEATGDPVVRERVAGWYRALLGAGDRAMLYAALVPGMFVLALLLDEPDEVSRALADAVDQLR